MKARWGMKALRRGGSTGHLGIRGFTLVELLVAIAIVAVFAAILLTVFPQGREKAREAQCTSGVRQLLAAASMYAHDHDRRFMPAMTRPAPGGAQGYTWLTIIQPYLENEQILVCPNDPEPKSTDGFVCAPHSYGLNYRYTFNTGFGWSPGSLTSKLTNVDRHSERILVFEKDGSARDPGARYQTHRLSRVAARHGERAVFGFIDGHAKALIPEETVGQVNMWQ